MKVSVLMPTYNDASTIINAVDSVIRQDHTDWELIVIDDGSTDNTVEVLKPYLTRLGIIYIYQENADQLNAILKGLHHISGDYVYI